MASGATKTNMINMATYGYWEETWRRISYDQHGTLAKCHRILMNFEIVSCFKNAQCLPFWSSLQNWILAWQLGMEHMWKTGKKGKLKNIGVHVLDSCWYIYYTYVPLYTWYIPRLGQFLILLGVNFFGRLGLCLGLHLPWSSPNHHHLSIILYIILKLSSWINYCQL